MEVALFVARLSLALVFAIAGIAKAADLSGSRRAFIESGLPDKLASAFGYSLPFIEILVAGALIPVGAAWWGAVGALALLLVFIAGIGVNLARGNRAECHCFGQLHSAPVSWKTLARNIALAAAAGFIIIEGKNNPGLSLSVWLSDLKATEAVSLLLSSAAILLVAVAVNYLRRVLSQQSTLLERIEAMKKVIDEDYAEPPVERQDVVAPVEGLPVGAPAPSFSLAAVNDETVTLEDLLAYGKQVLLLFISPNCGPCKTLIPEIKRWEREYSDKLTIALVSKGEMDETRSRAAEYGVKHLLLQGTSRVLPAYGAQWTPAAVLVNGEGRIASKVAYGDEAIRELVTSSVATGREKRKRKAATNGNGGGLQLTIGRPNSLRDLGQQAPDFSLPDLQGETVTTKDLLGRDTLLMFWDPNCPFCQSMADDIIELEENAPKSAPRLVFICSGEEEAVRAESRRFKAQFLYDPEFDVGPMFGTNLTPSAVLIDKKGKIASAPTAGRLEILALMGVHKAELPIAAMR